MRSIAIFCTLLVGFLGPGGARITGAAPLTSAHAAGAQFSGSGITLTAALTIAHASGVQVAGNVPTPVRRVNMTDVVESSAAARQQRKRHTR
jgi:hypothetical protein